MVNMGRYLLTVALIFFSAPLVADQDLRCLIEADDTIELSTPVAGIIKDVMVDRGDVVQAGQVIARLDTTFEEISLRLAEARAESDATVQARAARLAFLEAQAERTAALAERNAVSDTVADEARQEAEIARQELIDAEQNRAFAVIEAEQAAAMLDQKILRTPVSGVVTERLLSPGEYQAGETQIATIAKIDVLRIEAFAPLSLYADLSLGQSVTILPEDPIGGSYDAEITVIDRVFDAASGTFGIRMEMANPDLSLPAGLRCIVRFGSS